MYEDIYLDAVEYQVLRLEEDKKKKKKKEEVCKFQENFWTLCCFRINRNNETTLCAVRQRTWEAAILEYSVQSRPHSH